MNLFHTSRPAAPRFLLLPLFLAYTLWTVRLGHLWLWGDEAWALYLITQGPLGLMLETARDMHPPLYHYLVYGWVLFCGKSEFSVRFLSVVGQLIALALLYQVGRRLGNRTVGLVAVVVMALAPFSAHYAQEVRMYSWAMALGLLSTYLFLRVLAAEPVIREWRLWLAYGIVNFAAVYTLYSLAFLVVAQGILLFLGWRRYRRLIPSWMGIHVVLTLLSIPWLLFFGQATVSTLAVQSKGSVVLMPWTLVAKSVVGFLIGITLPDTTVFLLAIVPAAISLVGLLPLRIERGVPRGEQTLVLVSLALLPILVGYPLHLLLSWYKPRVFAFCAPLVYLLVARGLLWVWECARWVVVFPGLLTLGAFGCGLYDYYARFSRYDATFEHYWPLVQQVQSAVQAGDGLVYNARWQVGYLEAYNRGAPLRYWQADRLASLDELTAERHKVWVLVQGAARQRGGSGPLDVVEDWLAVQAYKVDEVYSGQMRLALYAVEQPEALVWRPVLVSQVDGLELIGYALNNDHPLEAGRDAITVDLGWRPTKSVNGDYRVSLRLRDTFPSVIAGRSSVHGVWAQVDRRVTDDLRPPVTWGVGQVIHDHQGLLVPATLPPGTYQVEMVLYRVTSTGLVGGETPLTLGTVQVVRSGQGWLQIGQPLAQPVEITFGRGLVLLGYSALPEQLLPGESFELTLLWRKVKSGRADYVASFNLVDSDGGSGGDHFTQPVGGVYPTSQWGQGSLVADRVMVIPDADTASGVGQLRLTVYDANGKVLGPGEIVLGNIPFGDLSRTFDPPVPLMPLSVRLGETAQLLGYDLVTETLQPGGALDLTLYWQGIASTKIAYSVFVHFMDDTQRIWVQVDRYPAWNRPTTGWLPGEVITDHYTIPLPSDLLAGHYTLVVGLYDANDGTRLPVTDATGTILGDHLLLHRVVIKP